jgi:hypothetical protein
VVTKKRGVFAQTQTIRQSAMMIHSEFIARFRSSGLPAGIIRRGPLSQLHDRFMKRLVAQDIAIFFYGETVLNFD